jgi:hypothetical protein
MVNATHVEHTNKLLLTMNTSLPNGFCYATRVSHKTEQLMLTVKQMLIQQICKHLRKLRSIQLDKYTTRASLRIQTALIGVLSSKGREEEGAWHVPKTVLVGFMATWFLAASPMSRSVSVKAT